MAEGDPVVEAGNLAGSNVLAASALQNANVLFAASMQLDEELNQIVVGMAQDARANAQNVQAVNLQALQNAVTVANQVAQQGVRHEALAADRQWNVDEVAQAVTKDKEFADAIKKAVVDAVTNVTSPSA